MSTFKTDAPTAPGFYPIIWPVANLLTVAEIPEGFKDKDPIIKTTHSGCFWSLEDLQRMGVQWGEKLNISAPPATKKSRMKKKEDRTDDEAQESVLDKLL